MLMALFQNKESLSSNKTTRVCGQADKNVQLQARPRGLIGVRRDFNLLLHPIVIRRLTGKRDYPGDKEEKQSDIRGTASFCIIQMRAVPLSHSGRTGNF